MKINLMLLSFLIFMSNAITVSQAQAAAPVCINIYYDKSSDQQYSLGKTYSIYLQNLLGHFPKYQQIISPVELYQPGDIEKCHATFYIGSYFDNKIPPSFFKDFAKTKKGFAWLGYNIWQLEPELIKKTFGYQYSHVTKLDSEKLDSKGQPGFFRFIKYKGETFEKFGAYVGENKEFRAGFEMVALKTPDEAPIVKPEVLSTAVHSTSGEQLPYIVRNKNFFYVADVPFSFVHEADRYLVFSDILFDVLGEKPRHQTKKALLRIEDVHPKSPLPELYAISKVFAEEKIPLHIALVPIFFDPLYRYDRKADEEFVPMTHDSAFMSFIEKIKKENAEFIWHGATHQYGRMANPHTGYSTDDFEFWNAVENKPIAEDSVSFVLDRLDFGFDYLKKAGIEPLVWLTPHYQASALDYIIFARVFPWNIGRVIYFNFTTNQKWERETHLLYSAANSPEARRAAFENLNVQTTGNWSGQLFPYEIYGDVYGQRLFPEILGNPQPFQNSHVVYPRTLKEILADAKRNLVIRDAWASMFFHPYLLTDLYNDGIGKFPGDVEPLRYVIREIKKLGYEFISTKDFIKKNDILRPAPIYKDQGEK